jgi:hypothetical protein
MAGYSDVSGGWLAALHRSTLPCHGSASRVGAGMATGASRDGLLVSSCRKLLSAYSMRIARFWCGFYCPRVPPHRLMSLPRNLARCATLRHLPPVLGKEQGRKLCQVFIKLELSEDVWFGAPARRHTVLSLSLYLGLLLRDFPPLLDPTFFSSQREVLKIRGYTSSNSSRPYCQPHRSLYHFPLLLGIYRMATTSFLPDG